MSKFKMGDKVRKVSGSQWHGTVVGTYSTELTPEGYAVESSTEKGSVQIYPAKALELWEPASKPWVGLTGHEQKALMSMNVRDAVFKAEQMLKERNT